MSTSKLRVVAAILIGVIALYALLAFIRVAKARSNLSIIVTTPPSGTTDATSGYAIKTLILTNDGLAPAAFWAASDGGPLSRVMFNEGRGWSPAPFGTMTHARISRLAPGGAISFATLVPLSFISNVTMWRIEVDYEDIRPADRLLDIVPKTFQALRPQLKLSRTVVSSAFAGAGTETKNHNGEQNGPANGSQPIRSRTNTTSTGAGSRR